MLIKAGKMTVTVAAAMAAAVVPIAMNANAQIPIMHAILASAPVSIADCLVTLAACAKPFSIF
jgi:hypothetical protein